MNDGPGIRTTVFLKGCPLRCAWCHNPESQNRGPEILYNGKICVNCGSCSTVCPEQCHQMKPTHNFDRSACVGCGLCAEKCPTEALRLAGRRASVEEVMQEVLRDRDYYEESGGLTVSGGEPLMQVEFLQQLLSLAKEHGIHTCVETCGYAKTEDFEKILPFVDCFLFDWKESDSQKHKEFTGKDNALIRKNLEFLDGEHAEIVLRIPLIPGYNDSEEHRDGIAALANTCKSIRKIDILPYHPLGISKEKELGRNTIQQESTIPDKDFLKEYVEELRKKTEITISI